jgi:signal transduction histidine kinase
MAVPSGHPANVGKARSRLSLLALIYVIVGILVALVLATAGGSYALSQRTENATTHLDTISRPAQASTSDLAKAYTTQADNVRGYLLTGNRAFLPLDVAAQNDAARQQQAMRQQLADDPTAIQLVDQVSNAARVWRNDYVTPEVNALLSGANSPGQLPSVTPPTDTPGERSYEVLESRLTDLQNHITQRAAQETAVVDSTRAITDVLTMATSAVAIILAIATVFFLRSSLTRPLRRLVSDVSVVSQGNLDQPVRSGGPAELAATADAVDRMRARILEQTDAAGQAQQQLARYEESERIAHGLHDRVIQRLVGVGMMLHSSALRHPEVSRELSSSIIDLDRTIQDLRTVIVGLTGAGASGIRQQVLEVVQDSERSLGFPPRVYFHGAIEPVISDAITDELLPTVRECLSNIARHAHADQAELSLNTTDQELILRISDNGVGIDPDQKGRGWGLTNIDRRAQRLGGTCTVSRVQPHGTSIDWRVPLQRTGPDDLRSFRGRP